MCLSHSAHHQHVSIAVTTTSGQFTRVLRMQTICQNAYVNRWILKGMAHTGYTVTEYRLINC